MRRIASFLIAASLLLGPSAANIAPLEDDSTARASETARDFFQGFNTANIDAIAATYSDSGEFVWVENGVLSYDDKAAAVAGMKDRLAATPGARLDTPEGWKVIAVGEDGAEIVAPITLYVKDAKTGDEKAVLSGMMTLLLRLEDGAWRIVTGHTSTAISMQ